MTIRVLGRRAIGVVVIACTVSTAVPAGSAVAQQGEADVVVEVSAPRNILPAGGWTSIYTHVRNIGTAAADNVRFTTTLPPQLRVLGMDTSSEWDCDFSTPGTATCEHVGPLEPGVNPHYLRFTADAGFQPPVGASVTATASVTTTSPESVTDNNHSGAQIRFVGTGAVTGRIWHDLDADGVREPHEPLVDSIGITFRALDDEDWTGFSNTANGEYWLDLAAKRFQAHVDVSTGSWRFTTPDIGGDATDSDIIPITEDTRNRHGASEIFTVEAGAQRVLDVGVVAVQANAWIDGIVNRPPSSSWRSAVASR